MPKKTLAQLRSAFADNNKSTSNNNFGDNYPFWNMGENEQAVVRFLPDGNEDNPLMFVREKLMHKLFINGQRKSVPCLRMYGEECPICKLSQDYYKAEGDGSINGKKYWRNKQHIARAVIIEDPLPEDPETGENAEGKVKTLTLTWQVYEAVNDAIQSGDLEEIPFDYENGCNFAIRKKMKKTPSGTFPVYTSSSFVRKSTPLSDHIDIDEVELRDLTEFLPKNPGLEQIEAWLEADINGTSIEENEEAGDESETNLKNLKTKRKAEPETNAKTSKKKVKSKTNSETKENPTDEDLDAQADAIINEIFGDSIDNEDFDDEQAF